MDISIPDPVVAAKRRYEYGPSGHLPTEFVVEVTVFGVPVFSRVFTLPYEDRYGLEHRDYIGEEEEDLLVEKVGAEFAEHVKRLLASTRQIEVSG